MTNYPVVNGGFISNTLVNDATINIDVERTLKDKLSDVISVKDFGAKIDGVTDDTDALISYINYKITNMGSSKCLYIDIPEGTMVISKPPIDTGAYNIMIRGKGMLVSNIKMKSGGNGIWTHGSTTTPATGILQIEDLTMVDGNGSGSGVFAITCSFAESSTQDLDTITINNVEFRSFSKCMNIIDMPRNCYVNNMLCYGPDNTYQPNGAIIISSTSASKFGNYTWVWTKCMISNYEWGWDYSSITPMEGPRYYACTCYNGWGMIRAAVQNTENGMAVNTYQSPCWYITDCDWQGMGFALDLYNVRNVIVRGGFYTPNPCATSDYATKLPNDPMGNPRTHRSIMAFYYGDVILEGVEFDNGGGSFNSVDTIVFVNKNVSSFRARDTKFLTPDACLAAFEYESGGNSSRCGAFDSIWTEFGGQIKILDHDNNQINQEAVQDRAGSVYLGTCSVDGMYQIHGIEKSKVADSNNQVTITFPVRKAMTYNSSNGTYTSATSNLFIGGTPVVNVNVLNGSQNSSATAITLVSVTNEGFTFEYQGSGCEYQADVYYTAVGY